MAVKGYRSSMEFVKAMAQLFQRGHARGYALERILGFVEEEARRLLVDADQGLRKTIHSARQRLRGGKVTDGDLLGEARGLYAALEKAKRGSPGERKR
jgi:hypothetical protein